MVTNISINITAFTSTPGQITAEKCREWCFQQHYSSSYSGFLVLMCFNVLMAAVFMVLFKYSERVVHNTKLSEEQLSVILNSVVSLVFWVNALYGVYWIFIK